MSSFARTVLAVLVALFISAVILLVVGAVARSTGSAVGGVCAGPNASQYGDCVPNSHPCMNPAYARQHNIVCAPDPITGQTP